MTAEQKKEYNAAETAEREKEEATNPHCHFTIKHCCDNGIAL